jgi:hypothetical protein
MSRLGKKPVELPGGVSAAVSGQTVDVKGPKGTRAFTATDDVTLAVDDGAITVTPRGKSKRAPRPAAPAPAAASATSALWPSQPTAGTSTPSTPVPTTSPPSG